MAVQSEYKDFHDQAFEGMIGNQETNNLISRTVEDAAIGFGKVATQGDLDRTIVAATANDDIVRGITVREHSTEAATPNGYGVGESAMLMTMGTIWVTVADEVDAGDLVYMVVGTADAGKFTNDSATGDNLQIPGAIFDTSAGEDELALIRIGANVTGPVGPQGEPGDPA